MACYIPDYDEKINRLVTMIAIARASGREASNMTPTTICAHIRERLEFERQLFTRVLQRRALTLHLRCNN